MRIFLRGYIVSLGRRVWGCIYCRKRELLSVLSTAGCWIVIWGENILALCRWSQIWIGEMIWSIEEPSMRRKSNFFSNFSLKLSWSKMQFQIFSLIFWWEAKSLLEMNWLKSVKNLLVWRRIMSSNYSRVRIVPFCRRRSLNSRILKDW